MCILRTFVASVRVNYIQEINVMSEEDRNEIGGFLKPISELMEVCFDFHVLIPYRTGYSVFCRA